MIVIADALHFNSFKELWSARVSLMDGDHCSIGCQIEGKTKRGVASDAYSTALKMADEHNVSIANKLEV